MALNLKHKFRRVFAVLLSLLALGVFLILNPESYESEYLDTAASSAGETLAIDILTELKIKGRAPKTGYSRGQFYDDWPLVDGCSLRQKILKRDFHDTATLSTKDPCKVVSGSFVEPYTGQEISYHSSDEIAKGVQIDHVVALSDAWQKGAQNLSKDQRFNLATDPLNLLAVDASANMNKSDGDAATWLPKNKAFRCQYIARQVSVKYKYQLWVTQAEYDAISRILSRCPAQKAVGV